MKFIPKNIIIDFRKLPMREESLSRNSGNDWFIIIVLLSVGAAFRLPNLDMNSLWLDEAWRIVIADLPLKDPQQMPVAYFQQLISYDGLLRLMTTLFGYSEWSVRIISGLAGTAAVAATYALAKLVVGRKPALLAALFLALSPLHITYSQEAATYAIASLATILFLIGAARISVRPSGLYFTIVTISAAIMGLAHIYLLLFVTVVLCLYAVAGSNRQQTTYLLLAGLIAIVINIPQLIGLMSWQGTKLVADRGLNIDMCSYSLRILNSLVSGPFRDAFAPTIGSIKMSGALLKSLSALISSVFLVLMAVAAWRGIRRNRDLAIWIIAGGSYFIFLVLQPFLTNQAFIRYSVPIVAIFFIIYASLLDDKYTNKFRRVGYLFAMAVLAVFILVIYLDPPGKKWKPDVRGVANNIINDCSKDSRVYILNPSFPELSVYNFYLNNSACVVIKQPSYDNYFNDGNKGLLYMNKQQVNDENNWFQRSVNERMKEIQVLYIISEREKDRVNRIATGLRPYFSKVTSINNDSNDKIKGIRFEK